MKRVHGTIGYSNPTSYTGTIVSTEDTYNTGRKGYIITVKLDVPIERHGYTFDTYKFYGHDHEAWTMYDIKGE